MDWKLWIIGIPTLIFTALQYLDPGRKVLSAVHFPSVPGVDVIGFLSSLGFLLLLVMGLWRVGRLEKRWKSLQAEQEQHYQSWIAARHGEIAQRIAAEYQSLKTEVDTFITTGTQVLERFPVDLLKRLEQLESKMAAVKFPGDQARAELNRLLSRGEEIFTKARVIPTDPVTGPLKTRHVDEENSRWEQEVGLWLNKVKPEFRDDFMANFYMPVFLEPRETLILRTSVRLERLRSVKASVS